MAHVGDNHYIVSVTQLEIGNYEMLIQLITYIVRLSARARSPSIGQLTVHGVARWTALPSSAN